MILASFRHPTVCGGNLVAGQKEKNCRVDPENGNWVCLCSRKPKWNGPLVWLLLKEVYEAKLHLITDKATWAQFCTRIREPGGPFAGYLPSMLEPQRVRAIVLVIMQSVGNRKNPINTNLDELAWEMWRSIQRKRIIHRYTKAECKVKTLVHCR